ncbi:MAG: hypothetical protein FJ104_05540 [Deltaproteobacteria bacterium]|nr:hypothetical protein [Deltaproteobacteria bacterium]
MRPRPSLRSALLLLAAPLACSGEDDGPGDAASPEGLYRIGVHQLAAPCDAAVAPVSSGPTHFRIEREVLFGTRYFTFQTCASDLEESCAGGGLLGVTFTEAVEGGYRGITKISTGGGGGQPCVLRTKVATVALVGDEAQVTLESRETTAPELTGDACEPDAADGRALDCESLELIQGLRVD